MNKWGSRSIRVLNTCHPKLVRLCGEVLKVRDISATDGARSDDEQARLLREGFTTVGPGLSLHNISEEYPLSRAVDIAPYPIHYISRDEFMRIAQYGTQSVAEQKMLLNYLAQWYDMQGTVKGIAAQMGIKIRQGYDWNGNNDFSDQNFDDLPHVELDPSEW